MPQLGVLDEYGHRQRELRAVKSLASIGVALLAAWLVGCADTVTSSAGDAAPVDARLDVVGDRTDASVVLQRGTISVGAQHACALGAAGSVWCWGWNLVGVLGDGTTEDRLTPVRVLGIDSAIAVVVGQGMSCALLRDRTVRCWGLDPRSQLDHLPAPRDALILSPRQVMGLDDARSIGVVGGLLGNGYVCAVRADQRMWCWGRVEYAPGYAPNEAVLDPQAPSLIQGVDSLTLTPFYTCARAVSGGVLCWGPRFWDQTFPTQPVVVIAACGTATRA